MPEANNDTRWCSCGRPLHYTDASIQTRVDALIAELGPTIVVRTAKGAWHVPRHYIALHGLGHDAVPRLARRYGWAKLGDAGGDSGADHH